MTLTVSDNNAAAGIDYEYWSRMPGWTVREAAALMLNIDPDHLPEKSLDSETPGGRYYRRFRLLNRAWKMDELSSPTAPRDFLQWAFSNGMRFPEKLELPVRAGKPHRNWKKRYNKMKRERDQLQRHNEELAQQVQDEINPKELTTLLKLVLGMARAKFKYEGATKLHTVGLIKSALSAADLPLNKGTIKKVLNKAEDQLGKER